MSSSSLALIECKKALRDKLLSRCVHGHYHWINPNVEETTICPYTFCNSKDGSSTLAFHILRTLTITPPDQFLPLDEVLQNNFKVLLWRYIEEDYFACVSTADLVDGIESCEFTDYPYRYPVIFSAIGAILKRGDYALLPPTLCEMPLANLVVLLGYPVESLKAVINSGHNLSFPVVPSRMWGLVCLTPYMYVDPRVACYIVKTSNEVQPFGAPATHFIRSSYNSQYIAYPLVIYGKESFVEPSYMWKLISNAHTLLANDKYGDELYHAFVTWLRDNIKKCTPTKDDIDNTYPKRLEVLEIITEHFDKASVDLVASNLVDNYKLPAVVPMLLHLRAIGALPKKPRPEWESFFDTHSLDKRIVEYLCEDYRPRTLYSASPDFASEPDIMIQFGDGVRVQAYSEFLAVRSPLINMLIYGRDFKYVLTSNGKCKVLTLETGLPEFMTDHRGTINRWITYCYTGMFTTNTRAEDVMNLKILANYLQDEECEHAADQWMTYEYLTKKTHYHGNMCSESCVVCAHWKETGH